MLPTFHPALVGSGPMRQRSKRRICIPVFPRDHDKLVISATIRLSKKLHTGISCFISDMQLASW